MLSAPGWQSAIFVETVGHCASAVLFGLLIALLLRDRHFRHGRGNRLSLLAAALVFLWNVTELVLLGTRPHDVSAGVDVISQAAAYLSFCFLSVLPAVLLHISLGNSRTGALRVLPVVGYTVSLISIASQFPGTSTIRPDQSRFSLLLLTFGFALLSLGAWLRAEFLARRGEGSRSPNRVAFVSLFILATSYFHFQSGHTTDVWLGEAIWQHASVPIALLVLLGDYRFFLLDVFLRFTASACWIAIWIWVLYAADNALHLRAAVYSSDFRGAVAITVLGILIYLLARSLQQLQRLLTAVVFGRPPLDPLLRRLQALSGQNETELLAAAAQEIAGQYKSAQWTPVYPSSTVLSTGASVYEPTGEGELGGPSWAVVCLSVRFLQGDAARLFLGPRQGGRRFLSEDLSELSKASTVVGERVDRFRSHEVALLVGQAELRALQAQINPHFLFNALNTLYGIIGRHSPEARQLVLNLAEVFRARLQTNRTYVSLAEEMDLVRAYLDIEQLRLGPRLTFEIAVQQPLEQTPVPVLSIQPLVENAVRHGADASGRVRVVLRAFAAGDNLRILVEDCGRGFAETPAAAGNGTGLENVRRRLNLCYGTGSSLEIASSERGATVAFEVPLDRVSAGRVREGMLAS